ncbi:hypothetical protein [Noviherbaspirillum saxi]|nr:hypothetical protein [Noviherbaspirillum saxi]
MKTHLSRNILHKVFPNEKHLGAMSCGKSKAYRNGSSTAEIGVID